MNHTVIESPIGRLLLIGDERGLLRIDFQPTNRPDSPPPQSVERLAPLRDAALQLEQYFAGKRRQFTTPLVLEGTPFQCEVWRALQAIPFGATISYAELARRVARPSAVRAVGAANGRNPLPIIVPCHRVIGSDGTLTGYAGGLPIKQFLLRHEAPQIELASTMPTGTLSSGEIAAS